MIIDTTYLLPLAGVDVETDLLRAIAEGRASIGFEELGVSAISLFELEAKAAKLGVPVERVVEAVSAVASTLRVIPFTEPDVVRVAFDLKTLLADFIDCVIVATAAAVGEDLVTEDSRIHAVASEVRKRYGIRIYSYRDLVR